MTVLWKMFAAILALACLLSASAASAQSASNTVKARESYGRGQQLFRQGDFAGAKTAFEAAYAAVPNPIVLLSIAECQVRTEQFAEAVESFNRYLTERPTAPDRAQVEAQIAKLREKPGTVSVASTPSGAEVYLDGVHTGRLTPTDVSLSAGDHAISILLPGYARAERSVNVSLGGRQSLEVLLDPEAAPSAPVATPVAQTEVDSGTNSRSRTAIWVAAGAAGAGLVAGAILGGLALKNKSDFDKTPTEATADKGERLALFADVGFGVAVAGAVTAVVLYMTAGDEPAEQAFQVAPHLARNGAGLVGNLRF